MRKRKLDENAVGSSEKKGTKSEILTQQFKQGDLTWVEIHKSSWWPAQVVDDRSVSAKPRKKSKNELLVRLYGTYEYMYVDASRSNYEFEDMLKRENKTMKEKFLEALKQDRSLMLPKEQSELKSSKLKGVDCAEVSKDKKQPPELTKEPTGKEADEIDTAVKVCTNKEKTGDSSKRKRKLDFSKEEREEKGTKPKASKAEIPNTKKQKVAKHADFKNHESSIVRRFPHVASVGERTSLTISVVEAPISENQEEVKAKDLEIRKIVRDIIFGVTHLPTNQSLNICKDAMQRDTSNAESSRMNCHNAAESFGLKATYSRKKKSNKQGAGEMKCINRENEGVKEVISEVLETPSLKRDSSCRFEKSNAEEITAKYPSRDLKGKGKARDDKTSKNEAQKRSSLNSKHLKKSSELEAEASSDVSLLFSVKNTAPMAEEKGLLSERQVRVMQNLALIAPAGSPFGRNGFII